MEYFSYNRRTSHLTVSYVVVAAVTDADVVVDDYC